MIHVIKTQKRIYILKNKGRINTHSLFTERYGKMNKIDAFNNNIKRDLSLWLTGTGADMGPLYRYMRPAIFVRDYVRPKTNNIPHITRWTEWWQTIADKDPLLGPSLFEWAVAFTKGGDEDLLHAILDAMWPDEDERREYASKAQQSTGDEDIDYAHILDVINADYEVFKEAAIQTRLDYCVGSKCHRNCRRTIWWYRRVLANRDVDKIDLNCEAIPYANLLKLMACYETVCLNTYPLHEIGNAVAETSSNNPGGWLAFILNDAGPRYTQIHDGDCRTTVKGVAVMGQYVSDDGYTNDVTLELKWTNGKRVPDEKYLAALELYALTTDTLHTHNVAYIDSRLHHDEAAKGLELKWVNHNNMDRVRDGLAVANYNSILAVYEDMRREEAKYEAVCEDVIEEQSDLDAYEPNVSFSINSTMSFLLQSIGNTKSRWKY